MLEFRVDPAEQLKATRAANARNEARLAALDPRPTAERMAEAMVEMAENGQLVTAETLRLRGFTTAEVEAYGLDAADRATALRVRSIGAGR